MGSITLFVEEPADLDKIEAQMKNNRSVDWSYYTIQRYDSDYKAAARPLLSMALLAAGMVAVMIIGTQLILSLVFAKKCVIIVFHSNEVAKQADVVFLRWPAAEAGRRKSGRSILGRFCQDGFLKR